MEEWHICQFNLYFPKSRTKCIDGPQTLDSSEEKLPKGKNGGKNFRKSLRIPLPGQQHNTSSQPA